jgi:TRAP transporter TAXI family solute receptor
MLRRAWGGRIVWAALVVAAVGLQIGCARGPNEPALRKEVEEKLTKQVPAGLFDLTAFRRKGSSPMPAGETGASRLVVYYSADLRFKQDVDFAGWDKMSPKSLAFALGATEKGLFGVKPQNKSGDPLHVYGTSTYEWTNGAWKSVASATTGVSPAPEADNTAPPSRSKLLIDKLAAMVNVGPVGLDPQQDAIISDELDRATGNITRRLLRRQQVFTFASGPGGGEYARFGNAFVETVRKVRPEVSIRHVQTQGSVENARLLARGEADYAMIQADVAAQALAGKGPFAQGGPLTTLRALGSLFPEAVHIVTAASSPIGAVEDLKGKRVDIGPPQSGTRFTALAVLGAHGMAPADLREAAEGGHERAIRRLLAGQLDAFFVTIAAPAHALQEMAARWGLRLVALRPDTVARLVGENIGLVAMTLPALTYPGQSEPVPTVATAALLAAAADTPDGEVERVAEVLFGGAQLAAGGSAEAVKVAKDSALRGITIPVHPGASRVLTKRP